MAIRPFIWGDNLGPNNVISDGQASLDAAWRVYPILNDEGFLVDPQRVLIHPSFDAVEGDGIFTYDYNPETTRGFIYSPATRTETTLQKTLRGSIAIQQSQNEDDVLIQEIWIGGSKKASALASMFRTFYRFWTTIPAPGTYLVWQPADLSSYSYGVVITEVQLGPVENVTYREHPIQVGTAYGAFVSETLTVTMKIVTEFLVPRGVITLEGL